jgi:hypothetical protein
MAQLGITHRNQRRLILFFGGFQFFLRQRKNRLAAKL